MVLNWEPTIALNLLLCVIIVALGITVHKKRKDKVIPYITVAFGLFGISHLLSLFQLEDSLGSILIFLRFTAYFLVIVALSKV